MTLWLIVLVVFAIQLAFVLGLAQPYQASEEASLYGYTYEQLAVLGGSLIGTLAFFMSWLLVGRDPRAGRILPQFEPPAELEPAAAHYVHERTFDYRGLAAAVIGMAVKGALRIVEDVTHEASAEKKFRLEPIESVGKGLTGIELATYRALFPVSAALTLGKDEADGERLSAGRSELESQIKREHYGKSFRWNAIHSMTSAIIGIATAYTLLLVVSPNLDVAHTTIEQWLIMLVSCAIVTYFYVSPLFLPRVYRVRVREGLLLFVLASVASAIVAAIAYWLIGRAEAEAEMGRDWVVLGSGALFGAVITIFSWMMGAPTRSGRQLLDRIEGLGLYLSGREQDGGAVLGKAGRTPKHFEQLLPYAIALDVKEEWCERFSGAFDPAWTPEWYQGRIALDAAEMVSDLESALVSTPAPRSDKRKDG